MTVWINNIKLGKVLIDSGEGVLIDDNGVLTEGNCSAFYTQSFAPSTSVTVTGSERFQLDIRHRTEENAEAYIHDLEVTCTATPDTSDSSDASDGSSTSTHDEYCVSGFTGNQEHLNGEYTLYYDEDGDLEEDDNGFYYFRKHDLGGVSYLYLDNETTWVIGDTLNGDVLSFECAEEDDPDTNQYFLYLDDLNCDSDIVLTPYECQDEHSTISYIMGIVDYAQKSPSNLAVVVLTVFLFTFLCVFCVLSCMKGLVFSRPYAKIARYDSEMGDTEISVSNDEIISFA